MALAKTRILTGSGSSGDISSSKGEIPIPSATEFADDLYRSFLDQIKNLGLRAGMGFRVRVEIVEPGPWSEVFVRLPDEESLAQEWIDAACNKVQS